MDFGLGPAPDAMGRFSEELRALTPGGAFLRDAGGADLPALPRLPPEGFSGPLSDVDAMFEFHFVRLRQRFVGYG